MTTVSDDRGLELAIGAVTCVSCAARIEKTLIRLDGVTAAVNFATETARVAFPATVSTTDPISVVEAGYGPWSRPARTNSRTPALYVRHRLGVRVPVGLGGT